MNSQAGNAHEFGKVAVLMGGASAEREVSLKSGAAVLAALSASGVDAHSFDPAQRPLGDLWVDKFSRVFIVLHGRGGEDGTLQGALDWLRIPYTGSGVLASALAMDKWRCKLVWQAAGLPVPRFVRLEAGSDWAQVGKQLGLPLFVKPSAEGSSIGVHKVHTLAALPAAWADAADHDSVVLAEEYLGGGEYTVSIIETLAGIEALPAIRIQPTGEFYDYDAKYLRADTRYLVPAGLTEAGEAALRSLALSAWQALGCRGWARIDLLADSAGAPWLLEANTAPGMTDHSLVPMAAKAAGISFAQLVISILHTARFGV